MLFVVDFQSLACVGSLQLISGVSHRASEPGACRPGLVSLLQGERRAHLEVSLSISITVQAGTQEVTAARLSCHDDSATAITEENARTCV